MSAGAAAILLASLLGSLHCAGMCGPLAAVYAVEPATPAGRVIPHLAYNLARGLCYALLGAIAGAAGAAIDLAGILGGVQRAAAIASGLFMVVWGAFAMATALGARPRGRVARAAVLPGLVAGLALGRARSAVARATFLGVASALLPCGWLWAFVAVAMGTGSAPRGAGTMVLFWIGTLPVMLSVGVAARALAGPLRRHLPVVSAAIVMAVGLTVVVSRTLASHASPAPPTDASALSAPVPSEPPCHVEP